MKASSPFRKLLELFAEYTPASGYSVTGADLVKALKRRLRKLKGGIV